MQEYGKMVKAKDNDENFDTSMLERVGTELDELEIRLKANTLVTKEGFLEDDSNCDMGTNKVKCKAKRAGIKTKFKSKIPVQISK